MELKLPPDILEDFWQTYLKARDLKKEIYDDWQILELRKAHAAGISSLIVWYQDELNDLPVEQVLPLLDQLYENIQAYFNAVGTPLTANNIPQRFYLEYLQRCGVEPSKMSSVQYREMQYAFFAGVKTLHSFHIDFLCNFPDEEAADALINIKEQCAKFWLKAVEDYDARRAKGL